VSKLGQLLSYLDRGDVTRLEFTAGKAVMLHTTSRSHPVTVTPLSEAQIRKFFDGTSVAGFIPGDGTSPTALHRVVLLATNYEVAIAKQNGALMIEVRPDIARSTPRATPREQPRAQTGKSWPDRHSSRSQMAMPSAPPLPPTDTTTSQTPTRKETPIPGTIEPLRPGQHGGGRAIDLPPPEGGPLLLERDVGRRSPTAKSEAFVLETNATPVAIAERETSAPIQVAAENSGPILITPDTGMFRAADSTFADADPRQVEAASRSLGALLRRAREGGASDVHVVSDAPTRIRFASMLRPEKEPTPHHTVVCMVKSLLQTRHFEQLAARGYADLAIDVPGAGRMRINVCRQRTGLKACFRLVAPRPPTIEELGMPREVAKLQQHHQGLVLISGPNGHGKTTSMAALIDMFNASKPLHIITVEDPVEVLHPVKRALVSQREVGVHTRTFQTALAASLREDPDVIAIGELRDRETVEMALQASETGHLVLATMSTPSGAKTIDRVIDMFPPDDQSQVRATLAGALKLVLSQRLLRRKDGRGLVAAYELITGNIPLWALIRDKKLFQLPSLMQRGRNYGMIQLEDSLKELMRNGVISEEEANLYVEDRRALERK
jgi:twitching motility protein PilT